jgi:hypothetical protein
VDVERFLKRSALANERGDRSRTFLVLDAAPSAEDQVEILAFFTLAIGIMRISPEASRNKSRRLVGLFYDRNEMI